MTFATVEMFKRLGDFRGTSSRYEFFVPLTVYIALFTICMSIWKDFELSFTFFYTLFAFLSLPLFSLSVRRLRDAGIYPLFGILLLGHGFLPFTIVFAIDCIFLVIFSLPSRRTESD